MQTLASILVVLSVLAILAACSGPAEPAGSGGPKPGSRSGQAANSGERIFTNTCIACHQQSGAGIPGAYPSLAGSPVVLGAPRALARWVILGERPAAMPAGRYATQMPRFGWLKPDDAAALFTYLRSSFGNAAPPVDAAAVAAAIDR